MDTKLLQDQAITGPPGAKESFLKLHAMRWDDKKWLRAGHYNKKTVNAALKGKKFLKNA